MSYAWSNVTSCVHSSFNLASGRPGAYLKGVTRVLSGVLLATAFVVAMRCSTLADARTGSVVNFMNTLAETAIQANQKIDRNELEEIIRNHVDVEGIGNFALGSYLTQLRTAEMDGYYDAVINFLARYAAMQSRRYQVEKAEFYRPSYHKDNTITLRSKVTLAGGTSYRVKWRIIKTDGKFKVLDAKILGFWLTPIQRRMFRSYIRENNDDVHALVDVLGQ